MYVSVVDDASLGAGFVTNEHRTTASVLYATLYAVGEAKAVAPYIVGSRVLDLGAGENYVGAALLNLQSMWVCSADVGAFRRVPGSYVTYDGIRLPFIDDTFDTTLMLLTLHHCEHPERVLDEAVRVTRGRLIIIESVYRTGRQRFWLDVLDHWLGDSSFKQDAFLIKKPAGQ